MNKVILGGILAIALNTAMLAPVLAIKPAAQQIVALEMVKKIVALEMVKKMGSGSGSGGGSGDSSGSGSGGSGSSPVAPSADPNLAAPSGPASAGGAGAAPSPAGASKDPDDAPSGLTIKEVKSIAKQAYEKGLDKGKAPCSPKVRGKKDPHGAAGADSAPPAEKGTSTDPDDAPSGLTVKDVKSIAKQAYEKGLKQGKDLCKGTKGGSKKSHHGKNHDKKHDKNHGKKGDKPKVAKITPHIEGPKPNTPSVGNDE